MRMYIFLMVEHNVKIWKPFDEWLMLIIFMSLASSPDTELDSTYHTVHITGNRAARSTAVNIECCCCRLDFNLIHRYSQCAGSLLYSLLRLQIKPNNTDYLQHTSEISICSINYKLLTFHYHTHQEKHSPIVDIQHLCVDALSHLHPSMNKYHTSVSIVNSNVNHECCTWPPGHTIFEWHQRQTFLSPHVFLK